MNYNQAMMERMAVLEIKITKFHKILKTIEWVYNGLSQHPSCPYCGARKDKGHTESCELKTVLDERI